MQQEAPSLTFGKYTIYRKLAMGGMAELFLARQSGIGNFERTVVLKCILPHLAREEQFVTMFLDEARVASLLNHPNIVQIYEIGEVDEIYYIAMEYIRGPNLKAFRKRLYQRNPRPHYGLIAGVTAQIAAGLHCAHTATDDRGVPLNVIHRDVSPTNLLMSYTGAVKLVDFGVAKASNQEHQTRAGMVKGKYRYMSPEQVLARPMDQRSDIYALGAVLYELSTNVVVFGRRSEAETIRAVYQDPIMAPIDMIDGYPPELNTIVMRALARDRDERYETAEQMRRELEGFMQRKGRYYGTQEVSDILKGLFAEEVEFERSGLMGSELSRADYLRFASEPAASILRQSPEHSSPSGNFPSTTVDYQQTRASHTPAPADLTTPAFDPDLTQHTPDPSHPRGKAKERTTSAAQHLHLFPADIGTAPKIEVPKSEIIADHDPTIAFDNEVTYLDVRTGNPIAKPDTRPTPSPSFDDGAAKEQAKPKSNLLLLLVVIISLLAIAAATYFALREDNAKETTTPPPSREQASFQTLAQRIGEMLDKDQHIQAASHLAALRKQADTKTQKARIKELEQHLQCAPQLKVAKTFLNAGDYAHARNIALSLSKTCPYTKALQRLKAKIKRQARKANKR